MPQLVKKRRSGWAVLAAGALVASLFAVGAAPAAAIDENSEPGNVATHMACLGEAVEDQGFTDLGTLDATVPDINCLAYYGISAGKTADTFDPNTNVTRSQMALFLASAAKLVGADLMGGDMSADFGDIAELGENRQAAITSLARNGIMAGRGDMAFEPHADITRAEMATALVNLLDHTPGAPVHKDAQGLIVLGPTADGAKMPDDSFGDAGIHTRGLSQADVNAISASYELGITAGKAEDMFAPFDPVPRRNMATFITRVLNHSNLRPAGLTAQTVEGTVQVSLRDESFAPQVNEAIDAFKAATANAGKAFKDDGSCSNRVTSVEGSATCQIDVADAVTLSDGNIDLVQQDAEDVGDGLTVWIWTGDVGDKSDSDTDYFIVEVEKGTQPAVEGTTVKVTSDTPTGNHDDDVSTIDRLAHFGSTVTWTLQLQGANDADELVDTTLAPALAPLEFSLVRKVKLGPDSDGALLSQEPAETLAMGSDGVATFTVTANDPDADTAGNELIVEWKLELPEGVTGIEFGEGSAMGTTRFSDAAPVVAEVKVEVAQYQDAPGSDGTAGAAVTVTATDQYGNPMPRQMVTLSSDQDGMMGRGTSVVPSRARVTGSSGTVRIGYSYSGGATEETLTATHTRGEDMTTGEAKAYWVSQAEATMSGAVKILTLAADDDQLIVSATDNPVTPESVRYDSNDFFTVNGTPSSMADFEAAITKALEAKDEALTLAWSSYIYDDPTGIAFHQVSLTP